MPEFFDHFAGNTLLQEQAASCATDLALIEPDRVDNAFHCTVQIGIFEDDEGRFSAEFQGQFFAGPGCLAADVSPNFSRSGERDLLDISMPDDQLACLAVAGDNIDYSGWQRNLLQQLRKKQSG